MLDLGLTCYADPDFVVGKVQYMQKLFRFCSLLCPDPINPLKNGSIILLQS